MELDAGKTNAVMKEIYMNKYTLIAFLALFTVSNVTIAHATNEGIATLKQDIQKDRAKLNADVEKRKQDRRLLAEKRRVGDKMGVKQARMELAKDRATIKSDRQDIRKDKKALQQKRVEQRHHVKESKVG